MTEWEVYLSDGSTRNSRECTWENVPHGVLVMRVWGHPKFGKMVLWGDAHYGHPDTIKQEARVSDDEFARVLELAQSNAVPPSRR